MVTQNCQTAHSSVNSSRDETKFMSVKQVKMLTKLRTIKFSTLKFS